MSLFKQSLQYSAAIRRMQEANAALHANELQEKAAGTDHETPEHRRLKKAAAEAAAEVPRAYGGTQTA